MCHFISYIEYQDKVYFLDDIKLQTKEGQELLKLDYKDDLLGHGAIRHYYPELKNIKTNQSISIEEEEPEELSGNMDFFVMEVEELVHECHQHQNKKLIYF